MNKNIFKYFFIILITLFTLPILIDYLGLYKLAVFTNKIFTSESKKSNKVRSYNDVIFNKKNDRLLWYAIRSIWKIC